MNDGNHPTHSVLLYDGDCGVCTRSVQLVLRHDRRGDLRFASLQGAFATALLERHPALRGLDTVVWYAPAAPGRSERILVRSEAALAVAGYLGGWWRLAGAARLVPRVLRDVLYAWFARNRHRVFAGAPSCTLPTARERVRFLDLAPLLVAAFLPLTLAAQSAPSGGAAASYGERYAEIARLAPVPGQVADVRDLVLRRDAGELTFTRGTLVRLSPVGGRTVGVAFRGEGRFRLTPPDRAEREMLRRFAGTAALDTPITEAILLFADSTLAQLRDVNFGPGAMPGDVADHVRDLVRSLMGEHEGTLDADLMGPLLNGDTTGFFLAHVRRTRGDPVRFQLNRAAAEAIGLHREVNRREWGTRWALVTQFPARNQAPADARAWRYHQRLSVPRIRLDIRLTEQFNADISTSAVATLTLVAVEAVGPWLHFTLDPLLDVDSARWEGETGAAAPTFKADDEADLWVRAPRAAQPGDTLTLVLYYHGQMIDRYGDWFLVDPLASWYPQNRQGGGPALFDITYRSPARYPLISTGERVDSTLERGVVTTRWVNRTPALHATFNLGLFAGRRVEQRGAPPLDIFLSEDAHRLFARALASQGIQVLEQRNMAENVAADIANSLVVFTGQFGESPFARYTVSEIPFAEGVSFPGLIDLAWGTFQNTSLDGFDEWFRAHEAAHQWWGNAVRPASYRDAWLSEGLASYSALAYLQAKRRRNDEYYRFLDQYRSDILSYRDRAGPISIGYRNATPDTPNGYNYITYEKGAWVFHMLRILMLDLATQRADRMVETLRDFYQSFRGGTADTYDFQAVVEQHLGRRMGWFFDQWVRGTAIPTYHVAWTSQAADSGRYRVRLRITQEHVPEDFRMPVLVAVDLGNSRVARFRVEVHGGQTEYSSPLLPAEPRELTFNDFHSVLAEVRMERW